MKLHGTLKAVIITGISSEWDEKPWEGFEEESDLTKVLT